MTTRTSNPKSVDLEDINHDPSLLEGLSKANIKKLHLEAEKNEVPLAGNLRSILNALYNEHYPAEE